MCLVVLSPHPDDAVLSCWDRLTGPGEVLVVNVFTGRPRAGSAGWWDRLTGARCGAARMDERLAEDARVLARAGRSSVGLELLDGQHRPGAEAPERIAERVAAVLPQGASVLAPAALGGVPDHVAVREAALALDGHEVGLYADLPHAVRFGWPPSVTGDASAALDVDAWWRTTLGGGLVPEVRALDEAARRAKREAVLGYRTQAAALLALDPELRETLRFEVSWRRP